MNKKANVLCSREAVFARRNEEEIGFFIDWIASLTLAMTTGLRSSDAVIARRNDEAIQKKINIL